MGVGSSKLKPADQKSVSATTGSVAVARCAERDAVAAGHRAANDAGGEAAFRASVLTFPRVGQWLRVVPWATMKKQGWIWVGAAALVLLPLGACSDDDGGGDDNSCTDACQKQYDCDDKSNPQLHLDVSTCINSVCGGSGNVSAWVSCIESHACSHGIANDCEHSY